MPDFEQFPPLPEWFWYPVIFIYGAIVGSFLNVVIYRLPQGKSLTNPPSTCPNCGYVLGFWDNIPLLSFLALGARCRGEGCRKPISWRYFMVELVCACLWLALYHRVSGDLGTSWVDFVFQALFASVLLALVFIDLDVFLAPDSLTTLCIVLGVVRDLACIGLVYFFAQWSFPGIVRPYLMLGWVPQSIFGALTYGGLLFLVSWIGFAVYAREEGESFFGALRRYFTWLREDDSDAARPSQAESGMALVDPGGTAPEEAGAPSEEEDISEPPRLRFSPAFMGLLAALLLLPVVGAWGVLGFVVPLACFTLIARRRSEGESVIEVGRRFFRSDDLGLPGEETEDTAAIEAEAAEFAAEAETGQHGGMGFGDVKLALGIGALLGPGMALLSLFFATALGAITGVALAYRHGRSLRLGVPFVPFMAGGAIIVMLFGTSMISWYQELYTPKRFNTRPPLPPGRARRLERERSQRERLRPGSTATPPAPTRRAPGQN